MPTRRSGGMHASQLEERLARVEELTAKLSHQLDLQFKRTAQLQAQVDEIRAAANVRESGGARRRIQYE